MEYIAFIDESYINDSRYRSIASISFNRSQYERIFTEFQQILESSKVKEFKWQKLKDAKYFFCAQKIINMIFQELYKSALRVDVLIWDIYDSRHKVEGRDDQQNFERMFYHLVRNTTKKRQNSDYWYIYPDEKNDVNWDTLEGCIKNKGNQRKITETIFGYHIDLPYFYIKEFEPRESHEELLIQIADLFAGFAVFSKTQYSKYMVFQDKEIENGQDMLFDFNECSNKLSNRETYRCRLLSSFHEKCKENKLGVSLPSSSCLKTHNPRNPINFWHYEPQGEYDRAPIRDKL